MLVNSKEKKLGLSSIVAIFINNLVQKGLNEGLPARAMIMGATNELNLPQVKTKQFGNTVFEYISTPQEPTKAFVKSFNADTAENFVENIKLFSVWAKKVAGFKSLYSQYPDPSLNQVFRLVSMNPPMPNMGYTVVKTVNGNYQVAINLGD